MSYLLLLDHILTPHVQTELGSEITIIRDDDLAEVAP